MTVSRPGRRSAPRYAALARAAQPGQAVTDCDPAEFAAGRFGPAGHLEFLRGQIEAIPLPDNSVDVIISNALLVLGLDVSRSVRQS